MTADPLTPAEAVAIAAVLEAHPTREKHWLRWVEKLRAIANEAPTEESEIPSQDTNNGQMESTMEASNRTTPGERVNARTEGLTTDFLGV